MGTTIVLRNYNCLNVMTIRSSFVEFLIADTNIFETSMKSFILNLNFGLQIKLTPKAMACAIPNRGTFLAQSGLK